MNTMLFNCSLPNSQLHFILKNSSGFHTQKQLQDLDQQRTGHGVTGHGSALWKCALVLTSCRSMPVIFCLLFWMYDLGLKHLLGRMCCWVSISVGRNNFWKWWLFYHTSRSDRQSDMHRAPHLVGVLHHWLPHPVWRVPSQHPGVRNPAIVCFKW